MGALFSWGEKAEKKGEKEVLPPATCNLQPPSINLSQYSFSSFPRTLVSYGPISFHQGSRSLSLEANKITSCRD